MYINSIFLFFSRATIISFITFEKDKEYMKEGNFYKDIASVLII